MEYFIPKIFLFKVGLPFLYPGLLFPCFLPHSAVLLHYHTLIFWSCWCYYSLHLLHWLKLFHLYQFSHTTYLYHFFYSMPSTLSTISLFSNWVFEIYLFANVSHLGCIWLLQLPWSLQLWKYSIHSVWTLDLYSGFLPHLLLVFIDICIHSPYQSLLSLTHLVV